MVPEEERKRHYYKIYERARFTDWERFFNTAQGLEEIIKECFRHNPPFLKLVGSSSTGTMRKGHEDLDYAVAFQNYFNKDEFLDKIRSTELNITKVKQNKNYGYIKISSWYGEIKFVLVPMMHPNEKIETYEHDAFYHSDLINRIKREDYSFNAILAKEFFSKIGVYKEVKGIACELLVLKYGSFDEITRISLNFSSALSLSKTSFYYVFRFAIRARKIFILVLILTFGIKVFAHFDSRSPSGLRSIYFFKGFFFSKSSLISIAILLLRLIPLASQNFLNSFNIFSGKVIVNFL